MKGKDLVEWIESEGLMEAEVYVDIKHNYVKVTEAWESEFADGSVMLEVDEDADS